MLPQSLWRRRQSMLLLQAAKQSATALQALWRRRQALRQLRSAQAAAAVLQACVRARGVRARLAAQGAAALCIQRCARGMLARRQAAAERGLRDAVAEFQRTILLYNTRCVCRVCDWQAPGVRVRRVAARHLVGARWGGCVKSTARGWWVRGGEGSLHHRSAPGVCARRGMLRCCSAAGAWKGVEVAVKGSTQGKRLPDLLMHHPSQIEYCHLGLSDK